MVDDFKHKGLRKKLVDSLRQKGIKNKGILEAMMEIPRHWFLDSAFLGHAYEDKAFFIGQGQTISQPYTVAFMTELLDPQPRQKILEVGTGSGYQASILQTLGADVYSIELEEVLYERAEKLLQKIGIDVRLFLGDGSLGLPQHAPYDGIIVTAGAPPVPKTLIKQVKMGGKVIIPVGDDIDNLKMKVYVRATDTLFECDEYGSFSFVPLRGEKGWSNPQ